MYKKSIFWFWNCVIAIGYQVSYLLTANFWFCFQISIKTCKMVLHTPPVQFIFTTEQGAPLHVSTHAGGTLRNISEKNMFKILKILLQVFGAPKKKVLHTPLCKLLILGSQGRPLHVSTYRGGHWKYIYKKILLKIVDNFTSSFSGAPKKAIAHTVRQFIDTRKQGRPLHVCIYISGHWKILLKILLLVFEVPKKGITHTALQFMHVSMSIWRGEGGQTPRILTEKHIFVRNPLPGQYLLVRIPWVNLGEKSFLTCIFHLSDHL
jgi:hypothetical protein